MALIGFIGIGNMGYPMLLGAVRAFGKEEVRYTSVNMEQLLSAQEDTGLAFTKDNKSLIKECTYIVLAVKPQQFPDIYKDLRDTLLNHQILLSPAAGVSIADIKDGIGRDVKVIRFMPNTAAMVKEGMSCVCYSENISEDEKQTAIKFLTSFGRYIELPEYLMNAGVCASGSSPAYVYVFMEALADSVVKYGIPRDTAYTLVAQTVLGAAKMLLETKEHPGKLKDNVCSPGGTTIAGIAALEEQGFRSAVMKATDACYERAVSLINSKK